jgi:formylmethanofuran dehydrogenase subunit E
MTIKELRGKLDNASMLLEDAAELIDKTMEDSENEVLMTLKFNIEQAQEILDEVFYEAQDIEATIVGVIESMNEALAGNP